MRHHKPDSTAAQVYFSTWQNYVEYQKTVPCFWPRLLPPATRQLLFKRLMLDDFQRASWQDE
jgi:hypothetical protein